jgi:hypothetical protein
MMEWAAGLVTACVVLMVAYVSALAARQQRSERLALFQLVCGQPSERVRALAATPKGRIDAIRALREETGVDVKQAVAVVDALRQSTR